MMRFFLIPKASPLRNIFMEMFYGYFGYFRMPVVVLHQFELARICQLQHPPIPASFNPREQKRQHQITLLISKRCDIK